MHQLTDVDRRIFEVPEAGEANDKDQVLLF